MEKKRLEVEARGPLDFLKRIDTVLCSLPQRGEKRRTLYVDAVPGLAGRIGIIVIGRGGTTRDPDHYCETLSCNIISHYPLLTWQFKKVGPKRAAVQQMPEPLECSEGGR